MTEDLSRYAEDRARRVGDYRWPIVSSPYTRWFYVTALVVNTDDEALRQTVMPTDVELAVVDSFHREYIERWYNTGWLNRMRAEHMFDVDGGANSRYLLKVGDGEWKYRLRTWEHGPVPFYNQPPTDLLALLDRIHHDSRRWSDWKQRHADVFAAVAR